MIEDFLGLSGFGRSRMTSKALSQSNGGVDNLISYLSLGSSPTVKEDSELFLKPTESPP